jgi:diguanylate cyclase (GGDEF)-like protein
MTQATIDLPGRQKVQQQLQSRIDSLSYLPTAAAVAMRFVELGQDPDAEPADYARVIGADSSLSSKLLALANSSWAGVRNRVTTVKMAVNLLGLSTVRTLAISYCMTGLHNELQLSPTESQCFWEVSLSKAVAARICANLTEPKRADEAYVAGLFQDFALTLMYSVLREPYLTLLNDPALSAAGLLAAEREVFAADHAAVGRAIAQKLELPELFVDTVAFHHDAARLAELVANPVLREATSAAALLPHACNAWNSEDAAALGALLGRRRPSLELGNFISQVQTEFVQLFTFFNEGKLPDGKLPELLAAAARETADNTTRLVGTVNEMVREAAERGAQLHERMSTLESEATHDQLTGVLNRNGFTNRCKQELAKAARYGISLALCYLDVDRFKEFNDTYGHALGDAVLQMAIVQTQKVLPRQAIMGRLGGDEFVILLIGCSEENARSVAEQTVTAVARKSIDHEGHGLHASWSAGLLYVRPTNELQGLDDLMKAADQLMYAAKREGGNRLEMRVQ